MHNMQNQKYMTFLDKSVLLYGSETWALKKTEKNRLQAFHMKAQRRILQIKWNDFVRKRTKLPIFHSSYTRSTGSRAPHTPAHIARRHCADVAQGLRSTSPDSLLRLWRYINHLLTYLLTYIDLEDMLTDQDCTDVEIWLLAHDQALWKSLRPRWLGAAVSEWYVNVTVCDLQQSFKSIKTLQSLNDSSHMISRGSVQAQTS